MKIRTKPTMYPTLWLLGSLIGLYLMCLLSGCGKTFTVRDRAITFDGKISEDEKAVYEYVTETGESVKVEETPAE